MLSVHWEGVGPVCFVKKQFFFHFMPKGINALIHIDLADVLLYVMGISKRPAVQESNICDATYLSHPSGMA